MSRGSEAGGESPFEGRSAVVTGGASGLGRATAQHLAAAGCRVVIADLDSERGGAVAEQIDGHYVRVDVSDAGQNERMVAAAEQHHGGLDYAFLNAGVSTGCGLGEGFDLELSRRPPCRRCAAPAVARSSPPPRWRG
jgi:NAD(P)-dependent dehydrogenase (short-subunit alcohol dehydrogenase family)